MNAKSLLALIVVCILVIVTVIVAKVFMTLKIEGDPDIQRAQDYLIIALAASISGFISLAATMSVGNIITLQVISDGGVNDVQIAYCVTASTIAAVFATLAYDSINKSAIKEDNLTGSKECVGALSLGYASLFIAIVVWLMNRSYKTRSLLRSPLRK
jgi:hypothetical protein